MHLACEGTKLEYCELREFTYGFFANLAEAMGTDFMPFLPSALTLSMASCLSSDGIVFHKDKGETIPGKTNEVHNSTTLSHSEVLNVFQKDLRRTNIFSKRAWAHQQHSLMRSHQPHVLLANSLNMSGLTLCRIFSSFPIKEITCAVAPAYCLSSPLNANGCMKIFT